jgi:hypothetical protein
MVRGSMVRDIHLGLVKRLEPLSALDQSAPPLEMVLQAAPPMLG